MNLSKRNFELVEIPDFFVAGVSGAGKDTTADFMKSYYYFNKVRIADTIKRIICEKYNMSFEELEVQKRTNPELRKEHNTVGESLGKSYLNRIDLLCKRKAMDYQHMEKPENPIVIVDCRGFDEAELMFKNDCVGIFLTRSNTTEFQSSHWTDKGFFDIEGENNIFEVLLKHPNSKSIIVDNGKLFNHSNFLEVFKEKYEGKVSFELIAFNDGVDVTADILVGSIDQKLLELYPELKLYDEDDEDGIDYVTSTNNED